MRIGGNLSQYEFERLYAAKLRASPVVAEGWPHQCRCGNVTVVKYRGRFYCPRCGYRKRGCAYKMHGKACACLLPAADAEYARTRLAYGSTRR